MHLWSHTHTPDSPKERQRRATWYGKTLLVQTQGRNPKIANLGNYFHSQQTDCWLSPKSASHSEPWTLLSSFWSSSSPVSCRRTSFLLLWPGMHTPGKKNKNISSVTAKSLYLAYLAITIFSTNPRFSYLSKSTLSQNPVLSECVFSDWLPFRTKIQQNPLIDGYVASVQAKILSAELNCDSASCTDNWASCA